MYTHKVCSVTPGQQIEIRRKNVISVICSLSLSVDQVQPPPRYSRRFVLDTRLYNNAYYPSDNITFPNRINVVKDSPH